MQGMMYNPKITLEIQGIEKVYELIQEARTKINELDTTLDKMKSEAFDIQAKINQPPSEADGS